MLLLKKLQLFTFLSLVVFIASCDKKVCDCTGIIGSRLSYNLDKSAIANCMVVEDLQFNSDSTVTIFRTYKDSDGIQRSSELQSVAEWVFKDKSNCVLTLQSLSGQSYQFPSVVTDCNGSVDHNNSFLYDLQFQANRTLNLSDITCGALIINGTNFTW